MKRVNVLTTIILSAALWQGLLSNDIAAADEQDIDFMFGVKGGYSQVTGYYSDWCRGSGYYGMYVIPYIGSFYMIEADITYALYPLLNEEGAVLYSTAGSIGPLFYYQFFSFLQVYIGAAVKGNHFYLKANRESGEQETMKAGFIGKAGFFFPTPSGVVLRAGFEYSQNIQSGNSFATMNYFGGVSYGLTMWRGGALSPADEADRTFRKGQQQYQNGNPDEARRNFTKSLAADPRHREATLALEELDRMEKQLSQARELMSKKRYYEAIPLLEKSAERLPAAREDLKNARAALAAEIPALEKRGIAAYEREDYRECIGIMNRVLLIDPRNSTAQIYLPRARKRHEALERLK
jgi:tetratricopeptide (TPR) repeat protein